MDELQPSPFSAPLPPSEQPDLEQLIAEAEPAPQPLAEILQAARQSPEEPGLVDTAELPTVEPSIDVEQPEPPFIDPQVSKPRGRPSKMLRRP